MGGHRVDIVNNFKDFSSLEKEWNRLAETQCSPLLDFEWFYHAAKSFYTEEDLRVVTVQDGGRIRAIAPLVKIGSGISSRLEIIGSSFLFEPTGFLYESQLAMDRLAEAILSLNSYAIFERIPANSPVTRALNGLPSSKAVKIISGKGDGSSFLEIEGSWTDFERNFSRKKRDKFKYYNKLAKNKGVVEWKILYPSPEDLIPILDEVFRVESQGWKKEAGTAVLLRPEYKNFFYQYGLDLSRKGKLLIILMTIDGIAVASMYAVECYDRVWELKIGYNECYSDISPGILTKNRLIMHCFDKMLKGYEFLGIIEPTVHFIWTKEKHDYCRIRMYPVSTTGLMKLLSDSCDFAIRRFAGAVKKTFHIFF